MTTDHRALFERLVPALNRRDPEHLDEFFTEDVVIEYPQSGEVIRGLQNLREMYAHYPVGSHVDPTTVTRAAVPSTTRSRSCGPVSDIRSGSG